MAIIRRIAGHLYTWWPDWFGGVWVRFASDTDPDDVECHLILKTTEGSTIEIKQTKGKKDIGYTAP